MPYRPRRQPLEWLVEQIDDKLRGISATLEGTSLREKVRYLVAVQRHVSDLGITVCHDAGLAARGARERIRLYLIQYVGEVIDGEELQVVSGIAEFGRRIRELRVEQGYQIATGASPDPETGIVLRRDQYQLISPTPDADAARRWHVANRIRRMRGAAKDRILSYLRENVEIVVTTEELAYVARNATDFPRRIRELRTEQGYLIATRFTGRPDLRMGQYVLETLDRVAEPHDRNIPAEVERAVYARDQSTCRACGWQRDRWTRADPRILEIHHINEHAEGGPNVEENLLVLCSRCHDDVHAGRLVAVPDAGGFRFDRPNTIK